MKFLVMQIKMAFKIILPLLFAIIHSTTAATTTPATTAAKKTAVSLTCNAFNMTADLDHNVLGGKILNLTLENCATDKYWKGGNKIKASFQDCATNITEGDDWIIQENILKVRIGYNDKKDIVHRVTIYYYKLQCKFNRRLNVTNGVAVFVTDKEEKFVKTSMTNYTAEMTFFDSNLYAKEVSGDLKVTMFEGINIEIQAVHNSSLFKFVVEDCFATPSADPWDETRYLFFDDKCAIDTTLKVNNDYNQQGRYCFSIDAFRFILLKTQVYFHCSLLVCKKESTSDECTQKCKLGNGNLKRKRRAIEDGGLERVFVNSGAITYKRKPTCSDTLCPLNAHCVDLYPAVCRCNDGFVLDADTNECSDVNVLTVRNLHLDKEFASSYADTTSRDFIQLATNVEKELMTSYSLDKVVIKGVKVISAKPGSIVLDVLVKYSETVSPRQAFDSFIDSVLDAKTEAEVLDIKRNILPLLDVQESEITTGIIVVAVVVPLVFIMFVVVLVNLLVFRKRSQRSDEKPRGFDNVAVSMENLS